VLTVMPPVFNRKAPETSVIGAATLVRIMPATLTKVPEIEITPAWFMWIMAEPHRNVIDVPARITMLLPALMSILPSTVTRLSTATCSKLLPPTSRTSLFPICVVRSTFTFSVWLFPTTVSMLYWPWILICSAPGVSSIDISL